MEGAKDERYRVSEHIDLAQARGWSTGTYLGSRNFDYGSPWVQLCSTHLWLERSYSESSKNEISNCHVSIVFQHPSIPTINLCVPFFCLPIFLLDSLTFSIMKM